MVEKPVVVVMTSLPDVMVATSALVVIGVDEPAPELEPEPEAPAEPLLVAVARAEVRTLNAPLPDGVALAEASASIER